MAGARKSFEWICLVIGVLLSALSYSAVLLHFIMAKNQYEHDGDSLYFIPVFLLLFASLAIFGLRRLVVNGQKGIAATLCIAAFTLAAVLTRFFWSFPASVILHSPIFFACLGGAFLGLGQSPNSERIADIDGIKPKARVY
jgi:uncharacterized membrane-anchored protein YitT (DUF2179 family)